MRLKHELSSEPLHIFAQYLFLNSELYQAAGALRNLSVNNENKAKIVSKGALPRPQPQTLHPRTPKS